MWGWGGGGGGGVSACACALCAHMNRYRRRHADREFDHHVCTDVYLGIGVDPTRTHVPIFFVPSVGTPWSCWVGSNGESLVEGSEGSQDSFPWRCGFSLCVRGQVMRADISESTHIRACVFMPVSIRIRMCIYACVYGYTRKHARPL